MGAMQAVNAQLIQTYWQVGQHIVDFEQGGKSRADYGKALITNLTKDLSSRHGKGFSRSNLIRVRQFYLAYPKGATLSHLFSWSHIDSVELLKIEDPLKRGFYEQQCERELKKVVQAAWKAPCNVFSGMSCPPCATRSTTRKRDISAHGNAR